MTLPDFWRRNFSQLSSTITQVLENLFHEMSPSLNLVDFFPLT
jgi:hypothetical protein